MQVARRWRRAGRVRRSFAAEVRARVAADRDVVELVRRERRRPRGTTRRRAPGSRRTCLMRLKRSSSAAATSSPSTTSAAAASPWYALRPRIAVKPPILVAVSGDAGGRGTTLTATACASGSTCTRSGSHESRQLRAQSVCARLHDVASRRRAAARRAAGPGGRECSGARPRSTPLPRSTSRRGLAGSTASTARTCWRRHAPATWERATARRRLDRSAPSARRRCLASLSAVHAGRQLDRRAHAPAGARVARAFARASGASSRLERNVEDDVLGNHLVPQRPRARARRRRVRVARADAARHRPAARELPEQVLPDGGHYERSPAYHLLVLRDLLEVQAASPHSWLAETIERMRAFAAALQRPDGAPALFNDGGVDVAPRLDLPGAAGRARASSPDTGFAVVRDGRALARVSLRAAGARRSCRRTRTQMRCRSSSGGTANRSSSTRARSPTSPGADRDWFRGTARPLDARRRRARPVPAVGRLPLRAAAGVRAPLTQRGAPRGERRRCRAASGMSAGSSGAPAACRPGPARGQGRPPRREPAPLGVRSPGRCLARSGRRRRRRPRGQVGCRSGSANARETKVSVVRRVDAELPARARMDGRPAGLSVVAPTMSRCRGKGNREQRARSQQAGRRHRRRRIHRGPPRRRAASAAASSGSAPSISSPSSAGISSTTASRTSSADLREKDACHAAADGAATVFNLAADMGGMGFIETHKADCMVSVLINTNMLLASTDTGAERFLFGSSACVYAAGKQTRHGRDGARRGGRLSGDARGRLRLGEALQRADVPPLHGGLRDPARVPRFHNVYGPHGTYDGGREKAPAAICRKVIQAQLDGSNAIEIWGDGEQTRSFTYIEDTIEGHLPDHGERHDRPDQPRARRSSSRSTSSSTSSRASRASSSSATTSSTHRRACAAATATTR